MTNEEALDFLEKGDWFQAVYNNLPESTANEVAEAINTVGNAIRAAKKCDQMRPSFISDHSGGVNKMVDHVAEVGNMAQLTLEQLRQMDGKPAYWPEDESWGIIAVDSVGKWAGIPFFRGRWQGVNFEYDIEARGMEVYAYPPAHIDLEAWTAEWADNDESEEMMCKCSKCGYPVSYFWGKTGFCPGCGKAMTPEAWAILEKRLRG